MPYKALKDPKAKEIWKERFNEKRRARRAAERAAKRGLVAVWRAVLAPHTHKATNGVTLSDGWQFEHGRS